MWLPSVTSSTYTDWIVGSANANVRSFDLDSELNLTVDAATWTRAARLRLWSHNLGVSEATIGGWAVPAFIARPDQAKLQVVRAHPVP